MFRIFQYGNFVDMFMSYMLTYLSVPPYKGFSSKICAEFLPWTSRNLLGFLTLASCKMRSMGDSVCRRWVCITRSWVSWWGHTKMQEVCATFLEMIIIPSTTVRKKKPKLLMVLHGTSGIGSSVICQTFPSGFSPGTSEEFRFFLTSLLLLEIVLNNFGHFRTLAIF